MVFFFLSFLLFLHYGTNAYDKITGAYTRAQMKRSWKRKPRGGGDAIWIMYLDRTVKERFPVCAESYIRHV